VRLLSALTKSASAAQIVLDRLTTVADVAKATFASMEFGFLFDQDRQLLSIGYRCDDGALDSNVYDLLASDGAACQLHRNCKGGFARKALVPVGGGPWRRSSRLGSDLLVRIDVRISNALAWSCARPPAVYWRRTNRVIVSRQQKYGEWTRRALGNVGIRNITWRDNELPYQYSSFGVPDLGYKLGLRQNTVIAPYASGLAAMIDPAAATRNFKRLADLGARGVLWLVRGGRTIRARVSPKEQSTPSIRAYMAHHQAMTVLGIGNAGS